MTDAIGFGKDGPAPVDGWAPQRIDETGDTAEQDRQTLEALSRAVGDLLRASALPPSRVSVRLGAARIDAEWPSAAGAAAAGSAPAGHQLPAGAAPAEPESDPGLHRVTSPLVGTLYRAPEPDARPFVEVGETVRAGQQVAIVEAMKLMVPVEADRPGRVSRFLVDDGQPVEYGQPFLVLDPLEEG
ncbi:acetyl-CoA carboxylase biotin carboxyl carrier protein [Nocardiopsis sediminis]|uniref:Biotin carboxyl carrier protein of acetyl-CoA carboxylase n=1 Tax=Nocardiopsis sediminis TaxID=1778267 RepID=A0ABV8FPW9_9ACTN